MRTPTTVALLATFALLACGDDDPSGPVIEAPTIAFATTTHTAPFFMTGSTAAPTIVWNGETGTVALGAAVTGVTVDATTGMVSWDASLPLGVNAVDVVATNSAGSATAAIEVDGQLEGQFVGGYNFDSGSTTTTNDFEMTFNDDGTMSVLDSGASVGEGTWTIVGTTVTSVYSYDGGTSFLTVEGDVTHSATDAELEGFWYDGDTATAGSEAGYVLVAIVLP